MDTKYIYTPSRFMLPDSRYNETRADQEQGAEIYSVANDREQAAIVFNLAQQMAMDNPTLRKLCKFIDSRKRIIFTPTRSFYAAISSKVKRQIRA